MKKHWYGVIAMAKKEAFFTDALGKKIKGPLRKPMVQAFPKKVAANTVAETVLIRDILLLDKLWRIFESNVSGCLGFVEESGAQQASRRLFHSSET